MNIFRAGQTPSRPGPAEWFAGQVRIDAQFKPADPDRVQGALVTFEPGACTAWHTHPLGQTLFVTAGLGRVQHDGGGIKEIRPGDVVCFAPEERHWHGASPQAGMSHIAIHEVLNGKLVDWLDHVSDADYSA